MTTQVVTVGQPQEGQKGAELQMMAPPPGMGTNIVLPMGLPPGLAYLQSLNEVLIHQHFDVLEGNTLTQIQVHAVVQTIMSKCKLFKAPDTVVCLEKV